MTMHTHDRAAQDGRTPPGPPTAGGLSTLPARPRWLLPGILVAVVVGGLVIGGVLSPSAVLYAGLFGGMLLMHLGGHGGHGGGHAGHGGHGGGNAGHGGHGGGTSPDGADLSRRSGDSQLPAAGSGSGLDGRAISNSTTSETHHDDQRTTNACH